MTHLLRRALSFFFPAAVLCLGVKAAEPAIKPTLVLFLSDDPGVVFVGCYGTPAVHTPSIDALAREGIRLNRVFAASPTCSPSRAALFTGLYPQRNGTM